MKIVYLSNSTIPSRQANSIHVMKMCQAFANNGHEVTLTGLTSHGNSIQDVNDLYQYYGVANIFDLELMRVPNIPVINVILFSVLSLWVALKKKPDIVYARNLKTAFLASFLGLPVIIELHAPLSGLKFGFLYKKLFYYKNTKKIIVISNALKQILVQTYHLPEDFIHIAHDAADEVLLNDKSSTKQNVPFLQVGYVGHLYAGRGIELIINMAERCPWAHFHIVGGTEKALDRWQAKVKNLQNICLHGFVSPVEAEARRLQCDVLIAPYQREVGGDGGGNTVAWMSPLKIFEYMATGKAIICSDLPVLKEVLIDGENALLCQPDDLDSWVKSLENLRDNTNLRLKLGARALADFKKKYTWLQRARSVLEGI